MRTVSRPRRLVAFVALLASACASSGSDFDLGFPKDPRPSTPLHRAAKDSDPSRVRALIAAGADLNARGPGGATPLFEACNIAYPTPADLEIVRILLEAGADVDAPDDKGTTPLLLVVTHGDPATTSDYIRVLMEFGADPSVIDSDGDNVLINAVKRGASYVRPLLDLGVDPNATPEGGKSALEVAVEKREIATAVELIDAGATPLPLRDLIGMARPYDSPEDHASLAHALRIAVARGADASGAFDEAYAERLDDLVGVLIDIGLGTSATASAGSLQAQVLVSGEGEAGAPDAPSDADRSRVLEGAMGAALRNGRVDDVERLASSGAPPASSHDLYRALRDERLEMEEIEHAVECLHDSGADLDELDGGSTALERILHLAGKSDAAVTAVEALLAAGADPLLHPDVRTAWGALDTDGPLSGPWRCAIDAAHNEPDADALAAVVNRIVRTGGALVSHGVAAEDMILALGPVAPAAEGNEGVKWVLNEDLWQRQMDYFHACEADVDHVHLQAWRESERGIATFRRGDAERALEQFRHSAELASDGAHERERGLALWNQVVVHVSRQRYELAQDLLPGAITAMEHASTQNPEALAAELDGWAASLETMAQGLGEPEDEPTVTIEDLVELLRERAAAIRR